MLIARYNAAPDRSSEEIPRLLEGVFRHSGHMRAHGARGRFKLTPRVTSFQPCMQLLYLEVQLALGKHAAEGVLMDGVALGLHERLVVWRNGLLGHTVLLLEDAAVVKLLVLRCVVLYDVT